MTTKQIVAWGSGGVATAGVVIWLFATFETKEQQRFYIETHKAWGEAVLQRIDGNISQVKDDLRDVKSDLKDIKSTLNGRKVATFIPGLYTNLYVHP